MLQVISHVWQLLCLTLKDFIRLCSHILRHLPVGSYFYHASFLYIPVSASVYNYSSFLQSLAKIVGTANFFLSKCKFASLLGIEAG